MKSVIIIFLIALSAFAAQDRSADIDILTTRFRQIQYEKRTGSSDKRLGTLKDGLLLYIQSLGKKGRKEVLKEMKKQIKKNRKKLAYLSSSETERHEAMIILRNYLSPKRKKKTTQLNSYYKACRVYIDNGLSKDPKAAKLLADELLAQGFTLVAKPEQAMAILRTEESKKILKEYELLNKYNHPTTGALIGWVSPEVSSYAISASFNYRFLDEPVMEVNYEVFTGKTKRKKKKVKTLIPGTKNKSFNCNQWSLALKQKFNEDGIAYSHETSHSPELEIDFTKKECKDALNLSSTVNLKHLETVKKLLLENGYDELTTETQELIEKIETSSCSEQQVSHQRNHQRQQQTNKQKFAQSSRQRSRQVSRQKSAQSSRQRSRQVSRQK